MSRPPPRKETTVTENFVEDGTQTCQEQNFGSVHFTNPVEDKGSKRQVSEDLNTQKTVEEIHSRIRDQLIPLIDMEFETEDDAFEFYKTYAYNFGFSVRRSKSHKNKDGILVDRLFVCSAEGKRGVDKRDDFVKNHRAETRFGCLARMKISSRHTGKYQVIEFIPEHTHVTSSPTESHLFRSHRNMDLAQISQADMADSLGIAPKATLEFLSRQAGGRQFLGFIPEDYRNYLRSKRTIQMRVGDTGGVLEYLQHMQLNDPNFFYAIQVDEDDLITNIFWVDARMIVDYDYFGDVVCFDTTYRKNKEGRPFVVFVGVNNHKQTIIFGAALLYDETAESFMWLFDTFSKAMSGKKPKSILTDQDAAMAKALASQWPETCHRLCIWHIYQNAAKNLSNVFEQFKMFAKDFSSCIYDYEDEDCFLNAWNDMLAKYNLQENDWLARLFNVKEKWALVYGRETFCADITTTQRSESMNSSVKKYVSYKYDLLRFFEHFQRLVDDRRYEELKADFKATQSSPSLSFPVEILKHAATVYTPKVLKVFQSELCKAHDCSLNFLGEVGTMSKYEVIPLEKPLHHTVTMDIADNTILCSCKKFQFAGILCAHALKVLSLKNVRCIPNQYILRRWTKNVKAGTVKVSCKITSPDDPKAQIARRYRELCRMHIQLATRASKSEGAYNIAILGLNNTLAEVDACLKKQVVQEAPLDACIGNDDGNSKVRGIKIRSRVAGSSKRPKNALEKAIKKKRSRNSVVDSARTHGMENILPSTHQMLNSAPSQMQYEEPVLPLTMQMSNRTPSQMQFLEPFQVVQPHSGEGHNKISDCLESSSSMMDLLQARIPSMGGFDFLNTQLTNSKNSNDEVQENQCYDTGGSSRADF